MTHSVPTRRSSDLAGRCGADLVLRFERNTLCFETAMIDADIDVEFGKTGVDMIRPALAPLLDKMGSVPVADLRAKPVARKSVVEGQSVSARVDLGGRRIIDKNTREQ